VGAGALSDVLRRHPGRIPEGPIPPHATRRVTPADPSIPGQIGEYYYVPRDLAARVFFELRTHDEARNASSAGTALPVVTEAAARQRLQFLAVPASPAFRIMLRIYVFDLAEGDEPVERLRIYDMDGGELLAEREVPFTGHPREAGRYDVAPYPNQIPIDLANDPALSDARSVRLEVSSVRWTLWGFLSLTNNTTHEVTVIAPQPVE
jgi:hypothetical protein